MRIFVLTGLVIAALTSAALAETKLRTAVLGDPDSYDPQIYTNSYAGEIVQQIFTALTEFEPDGTLGPGAAQSWAVSDDGKRYILNLRPDFTWSDGKPLTAEDWVFSFRRLMNPETASQRAPAFYEIANARDVNGGRKPLEALGVRAIDAATLEITLDYPNPEFPSILSTLYPAPAHALTEKGREWIRPANFVGNGPFILKAVSPSIRTDLIRNPRHPGDRRPKSEEVTTLFISDQPQSLRRYMAGEIDMVVEMWPSEFDKVPEAARDDRRIFDAGVSFMLGLNAKRAPLDDLRVRQALSLAIDRDMISGRIAGGQSRAATTIVPGAWTGLSTVPPPELQLPLGERRALARRLLADAGYTDENRPRVEIIFAGDTRRRISIALQAMWREIGVDTELVGSEVTAMYNDLQSGNYSIAIAGFDMGSLKDAIFFLSSFEKGGFFDFDRVALPAFDDAMLAARREADPAERRRKMSAAERIILDHWDIAPLYHEPNRYLIRPTVSGWLPAREPANWRHLGVR